MQSVPKIACHRYKIYSSILFLTFIVQSRIISQNLTPQHSWKYNTITHQLLQLEEDAFNNNINDKYFNSYKLIDSIIDYSSKKINDIKNDHSIISEKEKALKILKAIDQTLIEFNFITYFSVNQLNQAFVKTKIDINNLNFISHKDLREKSLDIYYSAKYYDKNDNLAIIHMSEEKYKYFNDNSKSYYYKIDCDLAGYIYLGIAEVNKLPMSLVEVPQHNFIRYQINKNEFINWDTNSSNTFSNNDFRNGLSPTTNKSFDKNEEEKYHYLKNMTNNDVVSYHYENIASYFIKNSDYQKAIESLEIALQLSPEEFHIKEYLASLYHNIGYKQLKNGLFEESIHNFNKSLKLYDMTHFINDNMGYALLRLKKLEEGKKFLDKSLQLGNNDLSYSHRNLALYYLYNDDLKNAKKHFDLAFENKSKTIDFLDFHFAEYLIKKGDNDQAIKHLRIAAENDEIEAIKKLKSLEY